MDEWYFNMRFANSFSADKASSAEGTKFWPILVAKPSDAVRKGSYVYPKGPYDHIVAASGRVEAMMWAVERPDGGRGFGFTGGHFHDNWANDDLRSHYLSNRVYKDYDELFEAIKAAWNALSPERLASLTHSGWVERAA
jgi:hypothetical protein